MRVSKASFALATIVAASFAVSASHAIPLITNVAEFGTMTATAAKALDVQGPVVSSTGNPGPGAAPNEGLQEGAYQFSDRTHEYTNARTNAAGVLTTSNTGNLQSFPYYLQGLEYIQTSNDNRDIIDYRLDVTLSAPVTAFLMIDNRNNGAATPPALNSPNTTDPVLGGPLQWVIDDGWSRVKSSQMPNGQADYLGSDEGGTVATADLRNHTTAGNEAGAGNGLNQFYSIYRKNFAAGAHTGFTKANGIPGGSTYTVAVGPQVGAIVAGDVNGSGVADISDYNIIRQNMFGTGKTRAQGDISGDGVVDFTDFRRWKDARTAAGAGADIGLVAVPEPASIALVALGTLALLGLGRRRNIR